MIIYYSNVCHWLFFFTFLWNKLLSLYRCMTLHVCLFLHQRVCVYIYILLLFNWKSVLPVGRIHVQGKTFVHAFIFLLFSLNSMSNQWTLILQLPDTHVKSRAKHKENKVEWYKIADKNLYIFRNDIHPIYTAFHFEKYNPIF